MATDDSFKHIVNGVNLVPNTATKVAAPGDFDYDTASGQFNFFSAAGASHPVTDTGTQTLTNKTIAVGSNHITGTVNKAAQFNASTGDLEASAVTDTELGYVSGVTSSIQTQLNNKQGTGNYIIALTGDVTATGPGSVPASLVATTNSTLTTLSALSLPGSQVTGNISGNSANVTGTVAINHGGTGQTTASAAYNALSPMTTTGDIEYESAPGVASRLPIGTTNQVLQVIGGIPSWQSFTALTNPMTTTGDIIYSSDNSGTAARLGIGTTGQVLEVVAGLPSWVTPPAPFLQASSQITTASTTLTNTSFTTFSNSPALTFTPTATGTYRIYSSIPCEQGTANVEGHLRIFNTSGGATLLYESQSDIRSTADIVTTSYTESFYTLTSGVSYQFDIQGGVSNTGTLAIRGDLAPFYMFAEQIVGTGGGGGGGANTALSNLITTSINQDLVPNSDLSKNLGGQTVRWAAVYTNIVDAGNGALFLQSDNIGTSGTTGVVTLISGDANGSTGNSGVINLKTGAITNVSNALNTGNVNISSGNTAGSGDSGNIQIQTGTSATSSGHITLFTAASAGQSGDININTGTAATGGSVNISPSGTGTPGTINLNGETHIGAASTTPTHQLNTSTGTNGSGVLTLTNAPAGTSGDPTGYIQININGTNRFIPFW